MILAGDIGGTSTRLAVFEVRNNALRTVVERSYPSREHAGLREIVSRFVAEHRPDIQHASFGIAGPVVAGRVKTPNLPWVIDAQDLADELGIAAAGLLNDVEANAYGIAALAAGDLVPLNAGTPGAAGNAAVIAAGTGLGEAMLYWDGQRHHPLASEGGHADFAPQTDQEIDLLRYLQAKFGHVSYERLLSGPGFFNVYCFLRDSGFAPEPAAVTDMIKRGEDPNPVIGQMGVDGTDRLSTATMDLFSTIYGAEAGNLALKCMAVGGVFVGGGIAPKLLPALQRGGFMRGFTAKGRFKGLMEGLEVKVALNPEAPLLGAAHYALRL